MNHESCLLNNCENCIECNSTIVLPNKAKDRILIEPSFLKVNEFISKPSSSNQTKLDQINNENFDNFITEVPIFNRQSYMRNSKSSLSFKQYQQENQKSKQVLNTEKDLSFYRKSFLTDKTENQLYYSFLRLYVDSLAKYTNQEIWHMVNFHNPRIKQLNQGLLIRFPKGTWFILVTGSIFIEGKLYLPHSCFGPNNLDCNQMQQNSAFLLNGNGSRNTECLTLEPTELLLIDYNCNGLPTSSSSTQYGSNNSLIQTNKFSNNHHNKQYLQQNLRVTTDVSNAKNFSTMHSPSVNINKQNNCPLVNTNAQLKNYPDYKNSYTNLINSLNKTYLNNFNQANGNITFNNDMYHSSMPHQRAASMYSCHSDTTTATNTTSSDSELDLNALTEHLVDEEEDDINDEELKKLAISTDELLFGGNHVFNNNLSNNLINNFISTEKPLSNQLLYLRQILEKNSLDRTENDNETILNYINSLSAFDKYDQSIKKQLASVMILAIIESPFTVILTHNEILDSFCCLIHGTVEHVFPNDVDLDRTQNSKILQSGDIFGITEPTLDNLYFKGIMKTLTPYCWFLCVTQHDFYKILSSTQMEVVKHEEHGQITLITEVRKVGVKKEKVIVRGTPEKLFYCVLDNHVDQYFIDDFLLTYRIFMPDFKATEDEGYNTEALENEEQINKKKLILIKTNPNAKFKHLVKGLDFICNKLLEWFEDVNLRDKVIRIVLMWINNYYLDFDLLSTLDNTCTNYSSGQVFLDLIRQKLSLNVSLLTHLRLLHIGLSTKAKIRHINLTRSNRNDEVLHFTILGGYERGYGIFVSKVDANSKVEQLGLRSGDQILEVNGINFAIITHAKALEVLRSTTHLQLTVKYNPFMFREMISMPEGAKTKKVSSTMLHLPNTSINNVPTRKNSSGSQNSSNSGSMNNTLSSKWQFGSNVSGSGTKIKKVIPRFANFITKHLSFTNDDINFQNDEIDFVKPLSNRSHSNPDLQKLSVQANSCQCSSSNLSIDTHSMLQSQQNVIRVFNAATGDFRFLFIHPETTAKEVVMVSVGEFSLCSSQSKSSEQTKSSLNYSLYEVSIVPEANNTIKQKRLPDQLNNLSERASIHSRYYIKENTLFSSSSNTNNNSNSSSSTNPNQLSDEVSAEILKECPMPITILSLNTTQIGIELTLADFNIFRAIEPQEFIFDIFEMKTDGLPENKLLEFESLSNKEMFWVINEILNENNLVKRIKIIKYFIKTANICRNLHNYNSMFAILSGLGHGSIQRLKQTWEKLSTKYHKILKALQLLMDPSRNMMHYRREIGTRSAPIIPFFPIVKKDLTFINLAHMTVADDGLVNFDKMRMISKEIRSIINMSSQPYVMPSNNNGFYLNTASDCNSLCTNKNCVNTKKQHRVSNIQAMVSGITGEVPLPPPPPTIAPSNSVNSKKIFEESFMKKKVRHYLEISFSKINYDEDFLLSKSIEIEPGQNSNLNNSHLQSSSSIKSSSKDQLSVNTGSTTTVNSAGNTSTNGNKTQGSPTLSSTSSGCSSGRLKFGADSPHQLRKLMSLSEIVDGGKSNKNHSHGLGQFLNYNHNNNHQNNSSNFHQPIAVLNSRFITSTQSATCQPQINLAENRSNNLSVSLENSRSLSSSNNSNILLNTVSFNAPLSIESSSVTSLRRLEQIQQLKKFQEQQYYFPYNNLLIPNQIPKTSNQLNSNQSSSSTIRPPLPNYDEAVQRNQKLTSLINNNNNKLGNLSSNC